MNFRFLKVQLFVIGTTLSIAMILFAAQKRETAQPQFRSIIDLTSSSASGIDLTSAQGTTLVAPAKVGGAWTVESLPTLRLVAPLAIIKAEHKNFPDSESLVTMDDVASYEREHGAVAQGAIVLVTGKTGTTPILSNDALRFLVEARNAVGIGNAGKEIVSSQENPYLAIKGIYQLENVANLDLLPRSGAIAVAAPQKIPGAAESPVRLMALVR